MKLSDVYVGIGAELSGMRSAFRKSHAESKAAGAKDGKAYADGFAKKQKEWAAQQVKKGKGGIFTDGTSGAGKRTGGRYAKPMQPRWEGKGLKRDSKGRLRDAKGRFASGGGMAGGIGLGIGAMGAAAVIGAAKRAVGFAVDQGIEAIQVAADFEQQMNRVKALTGTTGTEFDALTMKARELGATTVFSASEAAQGMGFLAQAGLKANQIIGAMPSVLNLAAAGQMDLGRSADIVTNIMSGMQIPVEGLGDAVDVLVQSFSGSQTDLSQLGEAFKYVGPLAAAANQQLPHTAVLLQALADKGLKASTAGTGLRRIFSELLNPTSKASQLFEKYGVSVTNADGSMRSGVALVKSLSAAVKAQGGEMQIAGEAIEAFGQRAGPAMIALLDQADNGKLDEFADKMHERFGKAAEVAATQMEGLNGAIKEMTSAIQEAQIAFGDLFKEDLEGWADGAATAIRAIPATINQGIAITKAVGGAGVKAFTPAAVSTAADVGMGIYDWWNGEKVDEKKREKDIDKEMNALKAKRSKAAAKAEEDAAKGPVKRYVPGTAEMFMANAMSTARGFAGGALNRFLPTSPGEGKLGMFGGTGAVKGDPFSAAAMAGASGLNLNNKHMVDPFAFAGSSRGLGTFAGPDGDPFSADAMNAAKKGGRFSGPNKNPFAALDAVPTSQTSAAGFSGVAELAKSIQGGLSPAENKTQKFQDKMISKTEASVTALGKIETNTRGGAKFGSADT